MMIKKKSAYLSTLLLVIPFFLLAGCHKEKANTGNPAAPADTSSDNIPPPDSGFDIGNGVNLQPSYYNNGRVSFGWALMKQNTRIKSVRIEIEPSVDIHLAASWIAGAVENGYEVIATYHKYKVLGSDDPDELVAAANWWKKNYDTLAQAGSFTINLMNEWGDHNLTANEYANAYNKAINIVREVYQGPVIIDCPGWGQETSVAADAVKGTDGVRIKDTDIILSVHIYPNGWNQARNHSLQKSDLDDLASAGRPCIVGEFGNAPAGDVDWSGLVQYAAYKGWPVLGWAWNGDGGDMNMVDPPWKSAATSATFTKSDYFTVIYSLL